MGRPLTDPNQLVLTYLWWRREGIGTKAIMDRLRTMFDTKIVGQRTVEMKVLVGDIWKVQTDFRGVTTNGFVTRAGNAVMGRGVALQAKRRFPGIERQLGKAITGGGNRVHMLDPCLFSFPVKHNWWQRADPDLIHRSVGELKELADRLPDRSFAIPLPGTGNGGLKPEEVWPLLQDLPDNVVVVVYDPEMLPK